MESEDISDELRDFLRENVASHEELEILLFLRNNAEPAWTSGAIASRLKVPAAAARQALVRLVDLHLAGDRPGEGVRYAPATPELAAAVEALARAWESNRLGVMNLMNQNAIERVRTKAMRMFADAFILGRKKDKDG